MTSVDICYAEDDIRRTGSVVVHDDTQSKHTQAQPSDLLVCQEAAIVSPSPHTLQIHGHRLPASTGQRSRLITITSSACHSVYYNTLPPSSTPRPPLR
ncbi:hypothetical protein ACOMHN_049957 [Nucella lapillus]